MKKLKHYCNFFKVISVLIFVGLVIIWPNYSFSDSNKIFNWKMQSIDTPALLGASITQRAYCDNIRKMTNGKIDIKLYTAGQLVPSVKIADSLKRGVVDIAYTTGAYCLGLIPEGILEASVLPPGLLRNINDWMEIYWYRGLDSIMREAYAKHGIYYLKSISIGDPSTHWSKKPMYKVEDLKGYKIRSFGYSSKTFQKLGATPTFVPHEETYTALAQGIIDGSQAPGSYYKRFKFYEVAPYYYLPGLNPFSTMSIQVSMKSWNELPDDLKHILETATVELSFDTNHRAYMEHLQMLEKLDELNAKLIIWPEEEIQKIRDAAMTFLPEIENKSSLCAKGIKIIKDYMKERNYIK
jgi:TRAP-type mannitol/chloroaromatic compound transport system substrate-binding protein